MKNERTFIRIIFFLIRQKISLTVKSIFVISEDYLIVKTTCEVLFSCIFMTERSQMGARVLHNGGMVTYNNFYYVTLPENKNWKQFPKVLKNANHLLNMNIAKTPQNNMILHNHCYV